MSEFIDYKYAGDNIRSVRPLKTTLEAYAVTGAAVMDTRGYGHANWFAAYALKLLDENKNLKAENEKAIQTNKHCIHVIGKIASPPGLTELTDYLSKNTSATPGAETCIEALKIIKNLQELVNEKVAEVSELKIKLSEVNSFLKHIKEGVTYYL